MPKWTARAVTRCDGAALETRAVDRDPSGFDLDDVAGKSADDLANWLRVASTCAGAQITAGETLLGDRNRQAGGDQIAAPEFAGDDAIDPAGAALSVFEISTPNALPTAIRTAAAIAIPAIVPMGPRAPSRR